MGSLGAPGGALGDGTLKDKLPPSLQQLFSISPEKMAEFDERATEWENDKKKLRAYIKHEAMIHFQIAGDLIRNPPPGRQGGPVVARMITVWYDLATELLNSMEEEAKK